MKKNMIRFMAAATITLLAQSGFAQVAAHSMKAKVPFDFKTSNASLTAGEYDIRAISNHGVPALLFRNVETHKASIVLASGLSIDKTNDGVVSFACTGAGKTNCSAQSVRIRGKQWNLFEPKLTAEERERTYTVKVPLANKRPAE